VLVKLRMRRSGVEGVALGRPTIRGPQRCPRPGNAAEIAVEETVAEESLSEVAEDGEDEVTVGDQGKDLFHHPHRPGQGPRLAAARAEAAGLARGGQQKPLRKRHLNEKDRKRAGRQAAEGKTQRRLVQ